MAGEPWPLLEQERYGEFLEMLEENYPDARGEWPDEYEDWQKDQQEKKKQLRDKGHDIQEIPISPDMFAQFCTAHGLRGLPQDLLGCAIEEYAEMTMVRTTE